MDDKAASSVGSRLLAIRQELNMKQVVFAEAVGCTQSFVSHIEHDRSGPSTSLLTAVERLGFSGSWLMTGAGSMRLPPVSRSVSVREVPCSTSDSSDSTNPSDFAGDHPRPSPFTALRILGRVPAGHPGASPVEEAFEGYFPMPTRDITDPKAFCLRVHGDSMVGVLDDGDLVVVSPALRTRLKPNDLVVVRIEPDDTLVKRYMRTNSGVCLLSSNHKYPPIIMSSSDTRTVEIIGKVTQIIHHLP